MNTIEIDDTKVVFLQIILTNGERTPTQTYPNDPIDEAFWKAHSGLGQLTKRGINQTYQFGRYVRKNYAKLFSADYDPSHVLARSAPDQIALKSAQSFLNGLFLPDKNELNINGANFKPFPISTENYKNVIKF